MGASLSTRYGNKHRSNKNIDQPFKNGSQFHPTFDVHDVVSKNGGSTNETSQSIDDPTKFLLRASGVEIDDEKSVEDVHAEEVIKRHVVDDANFIGKPTTLNEDDMNAPLSHYFINSRYRNIFFLFLFIRLLSFFLSFVSNDDDDEGMMAVEDLRDLGYQVQVNRRSFMLNVDIPVSYRKKTILYLMLHYKFYFLHFYIFHLRMKLNAVYLNY